MPRGRSEQERNEGIEAPQASVSAPFDEESARNLLGFFRRLSRLGAEESASKPIRETPEPEP